MTNQPVSTALIALALLGTAGSAVAKLNGWLPDDNARTALLLSFALLVGVTGNLLPKSSPMGDGLDAVGWRRAGRLLCFTAAAMLLFSIVWPGSHALLPTAIMGLVGLLLALCFSLLPHRSKEASAMKELDQNTPFRVSLLLLVGIAGALGLIVLDSLFGDRVAQMSAIIWVAILGAVSTWLAASKIAKR